MVAPRPFSPRDLATTRALADRLGFEIALDPDGSADPTLAALTEPGGLRRAVAASPLDIAPPTDDRPFFFHTIPLARALRLAVVDQGNVSFNVAAVVVLAGALVATALLAGACFLLPLAGARRTGSTVRARDGLFFAAIGVGYIMVEISQLQRLSVFLGHPTHGLVVVLAVLLLASGVGSFAVRRIPVGNRLAQTWPLIALPLVLAAFGILTPSLTAHARGLETSLRIAVAVTLLFPAGLAMGTAFPRGLQLATRGAAGEGPWLWAINWATSVLGSVVAVLVSISAGISATFWAGVAAYAVAAAMGLRMAGRLPPPLPPAGGEGGWGVAGRPDEPASPPVAAQFAPGSGAV